MTMSNNPTTRAIIEQVNHDATIWIGHSGSDNKEILCGQTFVAPSEGELEGIEVFSSMVTNPGNMVMTLHNFDPELRTWGPTIGSASIDLNNTNIEKWVKFHIPGMRLNKGKTYGFRLACPNSYIGVGEAAGSHAHPHLPAGRSGSLPKMIKKEILSHTSAWPSKLG